MNIANVKVDGVKAVANQVSPIPAGIVGATVSFQYDNEIWGALQKTVVFRSVVIRDVFDAGEVVTVPPEVVAEGCATLHVGVYGMNKQGTVVIPTLWAEIGPVLPAANPSGDPSVDPDLPIWAKIQTVIGDTEKLKTEDRSSLVGAVNEICAEVGKKANSSELQEVSENVKRAEAIAKGRAKGYVFDTVEDLDLWLSDEAHRVELAVGDNLYIRAVDVPDYWWDGTQKQQLETQKVELSDYVKNTDYATATRVGLVKADSNCGVRMEANGALCTYQASSNDIDGKRHIYRPITPANLDYAVKMGLSGSTSVWTDKEKADARELLGAVGKTDYATGEIPGLVCVPSILDGRYGFIQTNQITRPGGFIPCKATTGDINAKTQQYRPIVPANLDYAVRRGIAYNAQSMTPAEKKVACRWIGTLNVIENDNNTITVILPSGKQKTVDLSIIEIFT